MDAGAEVAEDGVRGGSEVVHDVGHGREGEPGAVLRGRKRVGDGVERG